MCYHHTYIVYMDAARSLMVQYAFAHCNLSLRAQEAGPTTLTFCI